MEKSAKEYYESRGISFEKHNKNDSSRQPNSSETAPADASQTTSTNGVASILRIFAFIIYIGGFIMGAYTIIVIDKYTRSNEFAFLPAIICWVASFVSGTMMYGFAEIVLLLQVIADK